MSAEQQGRRIIRAAQNEASDARRRLARMPLDASPAELVELEAAVRLADMRLEAAEREAQKLAEAEHREKVAAGERRRRKTAAASRQAELASQLRAIKSGAAATTAHDLNHEGRPTFPTTVEAFMALHPTFDPNATHHYEPEEGAA